MRLRLFAAVLPIIFALQVVAAPPGLQQYIVKTKHLIAQPHAKAVPSVQDVVRAAGGHIDYEWRDRLVVTLPDSAVQSLVQHPAVEFVQKVVIGVADAGTAAAASAEPAVTAAALRPVPASFPPWTSGTYSYDGQGNITSIGSNTYSYDAFSRLTASTTSGIPETYTYDRYGNLTQKVTGTGSTALTVQSGVDDGNHLSGHCYDAAGNLTDDGGVNCGTATETYSYDALNRMTMKWNHVTHTKEYYIYNANDERIAVIPCSETACTEQITFSFRDESGKVLRQFEVPYQQFDSPWTWVEDYVYRDGVLLAAERVPGQGGRRYFHTDHLGTPRLVTDSNGRRISEHDYFPFGVEATPLRQDTLPVNGYNREEPMKFTGHERDFSVGTSFENSNYIDYMHARSTVPQWGRFLSADPTWDSADIGHPQSWNRYSYVRNNPMGNTDPDGKICIPCAAVGALAAVSYESYRQVRSGEPVNNHRLLAAVGIGALAGATLGAAVEAAPVIYNAALANPGTVATGTALAADLLSPPGGSGLPVLASEETFRQAVVTGSEKLAGFSIDGTKGLVGATFNRNILGLTANVKGGSSIAGLFGALEAEAKAAGATKLSIIGHAIINGKLLSPEIAKRFGYEFNQINKDTIQLMKVIP